MLFLGDNLEKKNIHQNENFGQVQNMFCDFWGKKREIFKRFKVLKLLKCIKWIDCCTYIYNLHTQQQFKIACRHNNNNNNNNNNNTFNG